MLIEQIPITGREAAGAELSGASPAIEQLRQVIRKVARTQATILIRGEPGTGKGLVALSLHRQSPRAQGPFFRINCSQGSAAALERELFGHEKPAGTGVTTPEPGVFELADGGTVVLEDISEVSAGVQGKLLRLLQEGAFERVGGKQTLKTDVRILATTHRDLEAKVRCEEFREDLFLRLSIVPVVVPALREREGDIALLADPFRVACARRLGIDAPPLSAAGWSALERHAWPGNVRELQQRIELAVVTGTRAGARFIESAHLGFATRAGSPVPAAVDKDAVDPLAEMEKRHIYTVLDRCQWNRGNAAERLGISIRTLRNKLKEYGGSERSESSERQP